jgi:hypothetical protein
VRRRDDRFAVALPAAKNCGAIFMIGRSFRLWEQGHPVLALAPAADAAGRTSGYFSLRNAHKAFIVCMITQGNAAQVTLTPLQASDNLGTGSKALTAAAPIVTDLDTVSSDTLAAIAAAVNFQTDVALKNKLVIFEIDPAESMDVNNGFDHIAIQTSASNAANITCALIELLPLRFQQQIPPTATT